MKILVSKKPWSYKIELADFDKCIVQRKFDEMYGNTNLRPTLDRIPATNSTCSQPCVNVDAGTRIVPGSTIVLGRTVGRLRKHQANVLGSVVEVLLLFFINCDFAINCSQSIRHINMWIKSDYTVYK